MWQERRLVRTHTNTHTIISLFLSDLLKKNFSLLLLLLFQSRCLFLFLGLSNKVRNKSSSRFNQVPLTRSRSHFPDLIGFIVRPVGSGFFVLVQLFHVRSCLFKNHRNDIKPQWSFHLVAGTWPSAQCEVGGSDWTRTHPWSFSVPDVVVIICRNSGHKLLLCCLFRCNYFSFCVYFLLIWTISVCVADGGRGVKRIIGFLLSDDIQLYRRGNLVNVCLGVERCLSSHNETLVIIRLSFVTINSVWVNKCRLTLRRTRTSLCINEQIKDDSSTCVWSDKMTGTVC